MLRRSLSTLSTIVLLATVCASLPSPAVSQSPSVNVLVMGEDKDPGTVLRGNEIFNRVLSSIENQLNTHGFNYYDEEALKLRDGHVYQKLDRARRSDSELIETARLFTRPPIDVIAIFQIFTSSRPNVARTATLIDMRLSGRLLNVQSGQGLGNFEVESPRNWLAPLDCNDNCMMEVTGSHGRILGMDLGSVLADLLQSAMIQGSTPSDVDHRASLRRQYELIFENFSDSDIINVENYLKSFTGYESHRPIEQLASRIVFWYEGTTAPARVRNNMDRILLELDIRARVTIEGNRYTVARLPTRPAVRSGSNYNW